MTEMIHGGRYRVGENKMKTRSISRLASCVIIAGCPNVVFGNIPKFYKVAYKLNDYDDLNKYLASIETNQTDSLISNDETLCCKQPFRLDELKKVIPQLNK